MNAPLADLKPLIAAVGSGRSLTAAEADRAFHIIMAGEATASQTGAFLMALAMRGETIEEIAGGARGMRSHMHRLHAPEGAMDIVGTGGDGTHTLNVSTATALVVAGCGVTVAKHGNRAASSKSGAADVLSALGVNIDADFDLVQRAIDHGIGFMVAPRYHSAMRHVMPTRVEMGVRTIFNLLGPLSNPADVKLLFVGVFDEKWVEPVARVLGELGAERAWVVHSDDGCDELTLGGANKVATLADGKVEVFDVTAADAGLKSAPLDEIRGGTPQENAQAIRDLLDGKPGAYRDTVLLNAAAALIVAGKARDLDGGVALAQESIDSGAARQALERLVAITNLRN